MGNKHKYYNNENELTEEQYKGICVNCGFSFGSHRAKDDKCPTKDDDDYSIHRFETTKTHFTPVKE